MVKYISSLVIILTFVLFVLALFTKGLTHDMLLEAGVFLVSAKLIIMAYKIDKTETEIKNMLTLLNKNIKNLSVVSDTEKK
jgi:hypothetical protein